MEDHLHHHPSLSQSRMIEYLWDHLGREEHNAHRQPQHQFANQICNPIDHAKTCTSHHIYKINTIPSTVVIPRHLVVWVYGNLPAKSRFFVVLTDIWRVVPSNSASNGHCGPCRTFVCCSLVCVTSNSVAPLVKHLITETRSW